MTYLSDAFDRWENGPYAMQAIIGCCFEDKPGQWFVQLRTPADDLFDQVVLCTGFGGPTREAAIEHVRKYDPAISEVIEWDKPIVPYFAMAAFKPKAVSIPHGLLHALHRCREEIDLLCAEINKHHDEI